MIGRYMWVFGLPLVLALSFIGFIDFAVELPPNAYPLWVWFMSIYGLGVLVFGMEYLTRRSRGGL